MLNLIQHLSAPRVEIAGRARNDGNSSPRVFRQAQLPILRHNSVMFEFPSGLNPEMFPLAWLVGKWEGVGEISYHEEVPTQRVYNQVTFSHDGGPYLQYESIVRVLGAGQAPLPGPVLAAEGFDSPEVQALLGNRAETPPSDAAALEAVPTEAPAAEATATETVTTEPAGTASTGPGAAAVQPSTETDGVELPTAEEIAAAPVWSSETGYWRLSPLRHGSMASNEFQIEVFVATSDGRLMFFNGDAIPARVELASAKVVRSALSDDIAGSKRMYGYVQDQLAWAEDWVAYGHELGSYFSALLTRTVDGDGKPITT